MPFGLHSAPATFQRLLDQVIGPSLESHAFGSLDDIIVPGRSFDEHLANLREVLRRLRNAGLHVNLDKCCFCRSELQYLGHVVTNQGIKTDPDTVLAIKGIVSPTSLMDFRQFLGMISWYRRFIPRFSDTATPHSGCSEP